ncbi:MAG: flagellar protein FlgN [Nitrospira sp.]|nr:flagellar protein FlgN [Nitrospira sp.]
MVSTVQQPLSIASDPLLCRMLDKLTAFQALLIEEQDAIRSLSFGQFTSVTIRKTHLLDEIRELEHQRRNELTLSALYGSPSSRKQQEADLVAAIEQTDRLNRFNAALIGQSLEFLQGTLRIWQRSPQSAALYSSSGTAVASTGGRVRAKG